MKNKSLGITLLEVMLVMAIASAIIIMGLRFYAEIRDYAAQRQLLDNVNLLFEAADNFYQANCRSTVTYYDAYSVVSTERVARFDQGQVASSSYLGTMFNEGFLPSNWRKISPNPLLFGAGSDWRDSYFVQFVALPIQNTMSTQIYLREQIDSPPETHTAQLAFNSDDAQPNVYVYKIQVAVLLQNTAKQVFYKNSLGADCVSSLAAPNTVNTCASGGSSNGYLVWTRMPSGVKSSLLSKVGTKIRRKSENMLYLNDQMAGINKLYWGGSGGFRCGG